MNYTIKQRICQAHEDIMNKIEPLDTDDLLINITILQLILTIGGIIYLCLKIF